MTRAYPEVSPYTNVFMAEQRDSLDQHEMRWAKAVDDAEPKTHKAWRGILSWHSMIRAQIGEIRRALYDMGACLSPRGERYIAGLMRKGFKWYDPRPDVTLNTAQKRLADLLADMPHRWAELRAAEEAKE